MWALTLGRISGIVDSGAFTKHAIQYLSSGSLPHIVRRSAQRLSIERKRTVCDDGTSMQYRSRIKNSVLFDSHTYTSSATGGLGNTSWAWRYADSLRGAGQFVLFWRKFDLCFNWVLLETGCEHFGDNIRRIKWLDRRAVSFFSGCL